MEHTMKKYPLVGNRMMRAGALPILGIVSGIAWALSALFISPSLSNIGGALSGGPGLFWIWIIWTGILL